MSLVAKMSCEFCLVASFKAKLGRCRTCMLQCATVGHIGWGAWWYCGADSSVNSLTALLFALAGSGLLLLHILVWLGRKGSWFANGE